jgi:trimeric autotransporter adhesin
MSTKTTFKRIALVAVAALGLGVLSVAPSSATVGQVVVTSAAGTATTAKSDSSTAGTYSVRFLGASTGDSVTVSVVLKEVPTGADATILPQLMFIDTITAPTVNTNTTGLDAAGASLERGESATAASQRISIQPAAVNNYAGANFKVILDTASVGAASRTNKVLTAGTYVVTVITTPINGVANAAGTEGTIIYTDINIVVSALASASKISNAALSTVNIAAGATRAVEDTADESVAALATASTTAAATLGVYLRNASDAFAQESVTATITGPGVVGDGTTFGKSVVLRQSSAAGFDVFVRPDGTAGTASIVISTPSVTFAAKTITFYSAAAKTITAAVNKPVIAVSSNTAVVYAKAVDANGTRWGGAAYIVASAAADALIAGSATTPVACTYVAADDVHACPVSGTTAGTAKFKVIDAATVALATATSNEVSVRVSAGVPSSVKLAFDKATYAPGEKAQVWVTALDAAGLAVPEQTINNLFATGGITSSTAFSSGSDTLTATFAALAGATSATDGTVAGYKVYTVYMPMSSGAVTISATGGTGLATAGRVAVSASADVVNSSVDAATDAANEATDAANAATDAALAAADAADAATAAAQDASDAVAALSASVSKLISSLRAQITSLTNLVIKIQKKVRA